MHLQIMLLLEDIFFPSNIFDEIKKLKPSQGGEIHITDAIRNLILQRTSFFWKYFQRKIFRLRYN